MNDKEKFITEKMKKLVGDEGYSRPQAYAISMSMWNKKQKAQQGLTVDPTLPPAASATIVKNYDLPVMTYAEERAYSAAPQKQVDRILYNVQTQEPKQGLPAGTYTKVVYKDNSVDYLTPQGLQDFQRMNNYRLFQEQQRRQEGGYAQMGMFNNNMYDLNSIIGNQTMSPQQNFSLNNHPPVVQPQNQTILPPTPTFDKRDTTAVDMLMESQSLYQVPQEDIIKQDQQITESVLPTDKQVQQSQQAIQPQSNTSTTNVNRVNILNPYGGVSLDYALNYAGRGFGAGNPWQAGIGTGLSILKGARNFLTGFSEGKENQRVAQEMMDKQFDRPRQYVFAQEGGAIKNSEVIAQNAITDNPQGNINLEGNEYVLRNDGQIQPVVGEPHIKNGKIADGVDAQLNPGDKVLSDYVKLKPADVKELKERYNISLKKGSTFADAQKKLDQKLGIKKLEDEKATLLEKAEKAANISNADTRELSLNAISKSIGAVNEKINTLSGVREDNFNFLFERQESQEKLGNGNQLFDKNGKEVTEFAQEGKEKKGYYQQGGAGINPTLPPYGHEIINPIRMVQKGVNQGNEGYFVYYGDPKDPSADKVFFTNSEFNIKKDLKQPTSMSPANYEPMLQDYLRKTGGRVGQEVKMQEGGLYIQQLAEKHNIPLERAMELIKMQEGGEQQAQDQGQDIIMQIAQALQQGMLPDDIITSLIQNGVPHEQAMGMVEQVALQMQGQQEVPQEQMMAQQGYSFSTRYTPNITGYDVQGKSVLDQDTLSDVEFMQPYTGKGYGAKMADVEKTMNLHSWYFDTDEKKNKFREAVVKEGEQSEVKAFQEAYNKRIAEKGKEAGLKETDIKNVIEKVGFSGTGVQQLDGKFGAFTSTRPLYDFSKKDGEVEAEVEDIVQTPTGGTQKVEVKQNVKNIMPNFEPYIPMFSAIQPIAKQNVDFQRLAPIKQTVEPMLAEQARQYQTDVDRIEQIGMSPQQQEAILAQGLASSQMATNDAISRVETFNAQNQFQADQYNAGVQAKEQIMNAQMNDAYQDKMMATLANQEESIRNQYRTQFLQGQADRNYITNLNKINTLSDQFAVTPSGVEYLNNRSYAVPENRELNDALAKMTPEEREAYKRAQAIAAKKQNYTQMGLKR